MTDFSKVSNVRLVEIRAQRELGWPDFHPEDFCHRCGHRNISSWSVDDALWNEVLRPGEIVCPQCFVGLWEALNGKRHWILKMEK